MDKLVQWTVLNKVHLVLCNCGLPEHQLVVQYFPKDETETCFINVHLVSVHSFWKRLWIGIRYISGHKSDYGEFDEVCLNKSEAEAFANFLRDFINGG